MVYSEDDSWLDSLVKHAIFELNDEERKRVESITANQTHSSSSQQHITDFVLQHHNRVIALRENDLLVAVGCQIRVLSLTELKDAWVYASKKANESKTELSENWIRFVPYKLLETPEINFNIEAMMPNKNGRLLSVNGTGRLVVVCLPRQGFSDVSTKKKILCRTLTVGQKYYDAAAQVEVLKCQWHPLSETRTHLVVLGNDNMLRIFDMSVDIGEPEQSFDLSPNVSTPVKEQQQRQGFSIDDQDSGDEDAVTFSIGAGLSQDQSGWEPFTVFYALRSGHLYSLCPVIPYRSVVRRNHLDNLSCIAEVKYQQTMHFNKTVAHLYKLQSEWINALFASAQVSSSTNSLENDSLVITSSPDHMAYPVQRQGPFLINHTQPLNNGIEATDILFIDVEPVNVLAVAMNNGSVHNYIIGSEIDAQWQMPVRHIKYMWEKELALLLSDAEYLPRASLYETINLKAQHLPIYQRVSLVADPLYNDTYYAYHAGGVHAIAMTKWVEQLGQLITNYEEKKSSGEDAEKSLTSWLNEKKTSDVRLLINSSPYQNSGFVPIIGLVLITDIYLSYSLLAITSDYRLVTRDLNMRRNFSSVNKASETAIKAQLKNLGSNDDTGYQPVLSLPAFQLPKELDTLPKQAKIVVPPEMGGNKEVVITEETLCFFNKSSEQIRRETYNLKKAAEKMDTRLTMQQKEFERQVIMLRDLYDRLQAVQSPEVQATQQEKLKEMTSRHAKLRLKMDEQLRKLMNTYQPDLSNEEKDWINELEKLSKQIGGESGYKARIELLQSQIQELSLKSQSEKVSKPKVSNNINQTQLNNILRTLKQQTSSLNDAKQRVRNLENKLPATVA